MNNAKASDTIVVENKSSFNYGKLQAVVCMASSAAVSVGLIAWAVSAFS